MVATHGSAPATASLYSRGKMPPNVQRTWFFTELGRYG